MQANQSFHKTSPSGGWFVPPKRTSTANLREMVAYCLLNPITRAILDSVEGFALVLNEQRQVLAANPETLRALNIKDPECLVGMRPGEAFYCIHSNGTPDGCGTTKYCATCGATIAIMASQARNLSASKECLMTVVRNNRLEAHEFSVRATPLKLDDHHLTIFVMRDISAEKRREVLEMVFLHDLNNVITGLQGWSELLLHTPQDAQSTVQNIVSLSKRITLEIKNQRLVMQAEKGELKTSFVQVEVDYILQDVKTFFSGYQPDEVHRLSILSKDGSTTLTTCPALLTRVLANMVKNAFEATNSNDQVRVWFEKRGERPCFVVHNPGMIPEQTALQVFKRSFSTKGESGRGLGTYSMKLFGEQYLGGEVGFTTSKKEGTSFFITLPADKS